MLLLYSAGHHNIVNLKNHAHALSRKSNCADRHKTRLHNLGFRHVFDAALLDVQPGVNFAVVVAVS